MLDVDGGDDVDLGVQEFYHILPALLVATRAGNVGVSQLVHEDHLGWRSSTASRFISSKWEPRYSTNRRRITSRSSINSSVLCRP
jgi:hypothetical protein